MPTSKKPRQALNRYLQYSGIGFQMLGAIAICAYLGHLADGHWELAQPIFTIVGMFFGLGASLYLTLKSLKQLNEREEREKGD